MMRLRTHSPFRPLLAGVAALVLILAACGDDGGDAEDSRGGEATTSAPAATGGGGGGPAAGADAVDIVDFQFEPEELTVAAGTTVTFTNSDDFAHTATADDDSFDTGELEGGASGEITFDEAGEFSYFCAIHNYMKGTVVVE